MKNDVIILKNGDQVSGDLTDARISIRLAAGGESEIAKDKIKRVEILFEEDGVKTDEGKKEDEKNGE